jgi:hypothetical protein
LPGGAPGDQTQPAVGFDGRHHVIVWQDAYSSRFEDRPRIRVLRLGPDGAPVDREPVTVGDVWRNTPAYPAIAACRGTTLVTWQDEYSVRLARLGSPGGRVPQDEARKMATPGVSPMPQIACAGDRALLVWLEGNPAQLFAAAIELDGPLVMRPAAISSPEAAAAWPRVATDGSDYLVLWQAGNQTVGLEVDREGRPRSSRPVPIAPGSFMEGNYAAAGAGKRAYLVVWSVPSAGSRLHASTLRLAPETLSPARELGSAGAREPRIAAGDGGLVAVWSEPVAERNTGRTTARVVAARVDPSGAALGPALALSGADRDAATPAIAAGAHGFLVAWAHPGQGGYPVRRAPAGADVWARLLPAPVRSAPAPAIHLTQGPGAQSEPVVASNGDGFLWAWIDHSQDPRRIRVTRVSRDGVLLDDPGLVIDPGDPEVRQLRVVSDGRDYLLSWNARGIYALRIPHTRAPGQGSPIAVAPATRSYAVSFDGRSYVFVWIDRGIHTGSLTPDGRLGSRTLVHKEAFDPPSVDIACAPGSCLAVWIYHNNAYGYSSVVGRRVIDGQPEIAGQYGRSYSPSRGHRSEPAVEWTGTGYRIAWQQNGHSFGLTADRHGLITSRPGPLAGFSAPARRAANRHGQVLSTEVAKDEQWRIERVVGQMTAAARPARSEAPVPGAPVKLSDLFARVKAIAAADAWKARGWRDAELEAGFARLIANIDAVTQRGLAPVSFAEVIPGRTRPGKRAHIEFGGQSVSIRDDSGRASVKRALVVDRGGAYQSADSAIILSDGDLRVGFVDGSIIIATGSVDVAHVNRSVILAGGALEISHEGSSFEYGKGFGSILLSASRLSASFTRGAVVGAADGLMVGSLAGGVAINSPNRASIHTPAVVLSDAVRSPLETRLKAAVGRGEQPRVALYDAGQGAPIAFGWCDWPLEIVSGAHQGALKGFRVVHSSGDLVVLGRGNERVRLRPDSSVTPAFPAEPQLPLTSTTEVHGVGIYEPARARGRVVVDLQPGGRPLVLLLSAYEATRWQVRTQPGVDLRGVVLVGIHPQQVEGISPLVPVVTRVHRFGQKGHYAYLDEGGARSDGFATFEAILAELGISHIHSFHGSYSGERFVIPPGARGFVHVPPPVR